MTIAQSHPQNHIQDLYEQIRKLSELLASNCASLTAVERERASWERRCTFLEEEIEHLVADEEEWSFHRQAWLSAQGIQR